MLSEILDGYSVKHFARGSDRLRKVPAAKGDVSNIREGANELVLVTLDFIQACNLFTESLCLTPTTAAHQYDGFRECERLLRGASPVLVDQRSGLVATDLGLLRPMKRA